jgi:hypothetical protein
MPITPTIADSFDSPVGQFTNWTGLVGEVAPSPIGATNSYSGGVSQTATLQNIKHIDIRSFDQTSQTRTRTQRDLNKYHQGENASIQTIFVSGLPDAGTLQLVWNDEYGLDQTVSVLFDADVTELQAAMDQLVGAGNTTVTSTTGTFPFTVTFAKISHIVTLRTISFLTVVSAPLQAFVQVGDPNKPDKLWLASADPLNTSLTQADLRTQQTAQGESWEISSASTGYTTIGNLVVGRIPLYNNWSGAQIILTSAVVPFNISVISRDKSNPINFTTLAGASADVNISFIMPNLPVTLLDLTNSWVQFTSDPQGKFLDEGGSGQDSIQRTLSDNTVVNNISYQFTDSASHFTGSSDWVGGAVAWNRVTGIRFNFAGSGVTPNGQIITIIGLRALEKNWARMTLDQNTIQGSLVHPVHLTGNPNSTTTTITPVMMRAAVPAGPNVSDPLPSDIALDVTFDTGSLQNTSGFNRILVLLREVEEDPSHTSFIVGELRFRQNDINIYRYHIKREVTSGAIVDINQDAGGAITTIVNSKNGTDVGPGILAPLLANSKYRFEVEALANGLRCALYALDSGGAVQYTHFDTDYTFNSAFIRTTGRVGLWADFVDYDVSIDDLSAQSEVFSILRTTPFLTHTPIDGGQLFAEASVATDIFNGFTSMDPFDEVDIDSQRSLSGSSYKFVPGDRTVVDRPAGLAAGILPIDDWRHTTLEFDIWIPDSLMTDNLRPSIYFKNPDTAAFDINTGVIGPVDLDVIPNVWTHNVIDLTRFDKWPTGTYFLWIVSQRLPTDSWWIDNVSLKRLAVDWQIRAIEDGEWVSFGHMVNRQDGALHLPPEQRGRSVQLQAKALVQDAWIASYSLKPHYAELGRLIPQPTTVFESSTSHNYGAVDSDEEFAPDTEYGNVGSRNLATAFEEYITHNL